MREQPHPTSAQAQAHIQHGVPPYNFSRRYACDRCRGQKLRCIRDQMNSDGSCQRCRKAREKCTIAPSVRSGPAQERLTEMALEAANLQRPAPSSSPTSTRPVAAVAPAQTWEPELDNGQTDGLHLTSVPWLELVGPSFDVGNDLSFGTTAVGGEGRVGTGTGVGTTGTGVMEGRAPSSATATMSITPTSQNTNATSYSFPSIPDNFDFSPGFDISMENIAPGTSEKETQQSNQPHRTGAEEAPINDRDRVRTDLETRHKPISMGLNNIPVPSPPNGIGQSRASHREGSTSSTSSSSSSAELKDKCIQELSDLSASLMKDLHRVISCKLASSFLFTPSDSSPAEFIFRTLDGSVSNDNAIGRMLQGTEKFLEIVQLFHQPVQSPWPFPDLSLGGDFATFASRLENGSDAGDASPEAQMEKRWRILQSYLHGGQNSSAMSVPGAGSWLTEHLTSGIAQKPDVTSTLSVLTCYTCLLRIYETVFYVIHHSLECSPSLASAIKLPQTVPGLEINGFMLRNHRSLQIKILLQVSTYMLDSVEKTLAPMLSDSTFQALLKTLLRQEGLECSPGNETGMGSVRRLMMKVDGMTK